MAKYISAYTGNQIDSGVGNGLKLEGKTIATTLGDDDTTIPTSKAVADSQSDFVTTTDLSTALENKVDKVAGKGLSTNDYTNADKAKVDAISTTSLTYYVDATNGSDDNDGLTSATAFKTIGKARNIIRCIQPSGVYKRIRIAGGTYNETVDVYDEEELYIAIDGNVTITNLHISNSNYVEIAPKEASFTLTVGGWIRVEKTNCVSITPQLVTTVIYAMSSKLSLSRAVTITGGVPTWFTSSNLGIAVTENSLVIMSGSVTVNGTTTLEEGIRTNYNSSITLTNLTISNATTGIAVRGGLVRLGSYSVSANTKFYKTNGGQILTGAGVDAT